jgi:hypothetical protein
VCISAKETTMKKKYGVIFGFAALVIAAIFTLAGCGDLNGGGGSESGAPTVTNVTVTPETSTVAKGGTQTFTATVTGTNSPAQTVTWEVTGSEEAGTSIDDGVLIVAMDESATSLTVIATSTADPSKSGSTTVTVSGTATVASVTVSPATVDVAKGGTQTFTASVTGTGNPAQTVTWSVSGNSEVGTAITTTGGVLTVDVSETVATSLIVTATSTVDPYKSGTATVTVTGPGLYVGTATTPQAGTETLAKALTWLNSNAEDNTSYTIKLGADENLAPTTLSTSILNGKIGVTITLTTADTTPRTVQLSQKGSLFTVSNSVTLTLAGHVVIRGRSDNDSPLIRVGSNGALGGTLELKENAKITGNTSSHSNTGGESGSGVRIRSGGTFNMSGGEISDNHVPLEGGGGVRLSGDDSHNSTFTMSGGTITGNSATHGGGVFIHSHSATATFTMSGSAAISNNTAHAGGADGGFIGGGVFINGEDGTDTFNMSGNAVISGNTAGIGGGVGIMKGTLNKTGGSITGNTASGFDAPEIGHVAIGHAVFVPNVTEDGMEAYRDSDADTGDNITITWDGSSYTTKTGVETELNL